MHLLNTLLFATAAASAAISPPVQYEPPAAAVAAAKAAYYSTHNTSLSAHEKREGPNGGGVYTCSESDWQGRCDWTFWPVNMCVNLNATLGSTVRSFGPDLVDGFACELFELRGCQGGKEVFDASGYRQGGGGAG